MRLDPNNEKALVDALTGLLPVIRTRRQTIIEEWLQVHEAWKGKFSRTFFKSEMFNHYIPYFRRSIERMTKRGAQMVLPTTEFFEVYPLDEFDDEAGKNTENVMQYMLWLVRKKLRMYSVVKQLFRTHALYGRAILRPGVRVFIENGKQVVWPTLRVVDPFMFTMWPETVTDPADAQLIFEDAYIPFEQYEDDVTAGRSLALNVDELEDATWIDNIIRRLQSSGLTEPQNQNQPTATSETKDVPKTRFVWRTEVWFRKNGGWSFVHLVWNVRGGPKVVRKSRELFERPLFRVSIDREIPGEQYTSSLGSDQEPLQILLNDQINMALEGQAMEFSPPAAIDNNLVTRASSLVYRPRAKWLVPPEGVKWLEMKTPARQGLQGFQMTMGLMDAFSGSSPLAEGQPIRNLPRAGFAVSSLLSMSLADIRDVARSFEEDLLSPVLGDLFALTIRFVPERQLIRIPRTGNFKGLAATLKDLSGDYAFNWVGSLQSQDMQDRANRLMTLIGALTKGGPVILQDLASRGKRINWEALLKRMWRDGVGERGADSIIEDMPTGQPIPAETPAAGPDISQMVKDFGAANIGG